MRDTPVLKKAALFLALFVLAVGQYGLRAQQAQTLQNDYVFTTGVGTSADWLTPSLTHASIVEGDNSFSYVSDLGFGFLYEGTIYTHFSVNTNGNLRLGDERITGSYYTTPFSSSYSRYNIPKIVAVGADLYGTSLTYGVAGTAPNRIGVFTFNGYPKGNTACTFRFQVHLYEATGEIRMLYGQCADTALSCNYQIGIATNRTDALVVNPVTHAVTYSYSSSTSPVWPGQYRYYSFMPVACPCTNPYNLSVVQSGEDSVMLDWDVYNGLSPLTSIIEYGPAGFVRGSGRKVVASSKPFVIAGLRQDVKYTFYVRTVCNVGDTSRYSDGAELTIRSNPNSGCIDFTNLRGPNCTCTYGTAKYTQLVNGGWGGYLGPYANHGVVDYGPRAYGYVNGTANANLASRHTVHTDTAAMDSMCNYQLPIIPSGESASVRLGCAYGPYYCQSIVYDLIVDTNEADIILLKYAIVINNPRHSVNQQPRFTMQLLDSAGNLIDPSCGVADFNASDAARMADVTGSSWHTGCESNIFWKDWTPVGIEVSRYHGQSIKVRLTTFNCGQGGAKHFAYAYYTLSCTKAKLRSSSCTYGDTATLSAPRGFNYRWYSSDDTTQTLSTNRLVQIALDSNTYYCDISCIYNSSCMFRMSYNHFLVPDTIRDTVRHIICPGRSFTVNGESYYRPGWYVQNLRTVSGCDSLLYINVRHLDTIRDTIYRTICAGARFDTNGQSYHLAGEYTQHLRQPDSCYNNLVIRLTVNDTLRDTIYRTLCAGARFDTNGQSYYLAGEYTQHLRQPDSCYNNLVIRLSVNDTLRDTIYRTICAGARFDTNGQSYYLTGEYTQHLRQPDSCYNNLVIRLSVNDTLRDTIYRTICAGARFDTNGQSYYLTGEYTQHLRQPDSCYNNLVIRLSVNDTLRDTIYRTICAGARFDTNGQSYYIAGEYTQHLRQPDSCYNNLVIRLTVNDTLRDTIYRTICAGARFDTNGQSYYLAGEYTQHLRQPDSCYNNLVIRLSVNDTLRDTIYRTLCAGARFDTNGQSYYLTGEYTQHLRQPDSCYNNLVILLTVNDTLRDTIYRTICAGASFDTNGQSYYLAGEYTQHLRQSDSCFHNLVIRLTVNDTLRDTIYRTLCAGARFDTNGQSYINTGFYSELYLDTVSGCYSRLNIDLVVHDTFRNVIWQNICAGATFTQGGQSYYLQGTYFQQLRTIYGCDSITEIHLTVNDTLRDTLKFSLCAGQTVTVNDSIYYLDGWHRQNLRTPDGCDSILHIHLDVADTLRDTLFLSVCAGKTMDVNGQIYANRGWYRQHLRTPDGCDSILHIALMVDDTIRSHDYDTICDGNIYMYHDSAYRVAGAYRHLLKTPDGCDSIVTMHLFIRDTAVTHIYDTISDGDSYEFFGEQYFQQGVYSEVLTRQKNGCDSTIVLHLKVCRTTYTHLYDTICTNGTYIYADSVITDSGVFSRLEYSVDHCDSIILLHLTVLDYPTLSIVDSGTYCKGGTATLAAVTNANHITWSSYPADSTLGGQEHEFVIHVSPDRYVEYMATVDKQPYNCVTTGVVSLNKPYEIIAAMTMSPSEITSDNLQVAFSDISYGEVSSRKWLFHEDDPTTRDRQVFNDSIVYYTPSAESDSLEVSLVISSGYGCHDTAVNIYPILKGDIWVPNAFTPGRHSARQNNLFKIGHNNVLDYEIYIYSRAGLFVFHSTDPDISWDGTYKHKDCIPGAYVYIIRYTTKKYPKIVREKKGTVLLIR